MSIDVLEDLLQQVLPVALERLEERGGFHPFGAGRDGDGETWFVAAFDGAARPAGADLVAMLEERVGRRARGGEFVAVALASDVKLRGREGAPPREAVRVFLEHADGACVEVLMPYRQDPDTGRVETEELMPHPARPVVFLGRKP
jgi:hypothetical protein